MMLLASRTAGNPTLQILPIWFQVGPKAEVEGIDILRSAGLNYVELRKLGSVPLAKT